MQFNAQPAELAAMDDSALITWRARARAELDRLPPHSPDHARIAAAYDASTAEINERARRAWTRNT
ncbi:MAG TPA: hypothetical protein VHF26_26335 [Trebonia sp.]|nr:hypothetical protein [Trebonia sp.]